jgi:hypothetical protein
MSSPREVEIMDAIQARRDVLTATIIACRAAGDGEMALHIEGVLDAFNADPAAWLAEQERLMEAVAYACD